MLSPLALQLALAALVVFAVGGVLTAVLYPKIVGGTKGEKRLEAITASNRKPVERTGADEGRRKRNVEATLKEIEQAQQAKLKRNQNPGLMVRIRQAGLTWSRNMYIVICIGVGLAVLAISLTMFGFGPFSSMGFALAGGVILPNFYVNFMRKRRFKKFTNEFPNAVDVIVRGVKAGLPLIDCLKVIAKESQEPVASEFQTIVEDQTLGMPLPDSVARLPERIPLPEANFFAIVIVIQSRTGGSLSEALANLSKVLRDRKKMAAKVRAMSAEAKSSAGIIGSLPLIVTVLVWLTSPDYISLLFTTTPGNIVLAISGTWMMLGVIVMRKMINFDF